MTKTAYIALIAALIITGAGLYSVQTRLDSGKGEKEAAEEFLYLPGAEYLKMASLGHEGLLADLLWLKAVQNTGERKITGAGYEWIYKALDTVTSLDPNFYEPYEVGGLILSIEADKVDLSNKLLLKGVENNPDVWQFPFYLGFNYFFYMKDYRSAAMYMEMAASRPKSPPYLPSLASRLYVQADDPAYALQFLLRMYENTKDEKMRAGMLTRINQLKAAVIVKALQSATDIYIQRTGREPAVLSDLVVAGIIKGIPEEPNGGYFFLDRDGKVKSSKLGVNLGIYTRGGK